MLIVGILVVLISMLAIILIVNATRLFYYFIRVYIFPPSISTSIDTYNVPDVVIVEPEESEADRCFREYGEYYGQSYYF